VNAKHGQLCGEVLLKMGIKLIFLEELHVAKTTQWLKGRVLRKKLVLPIESWFFTFFFFAHGSA
jgi:hypothetical protein